jgi:hypothetical protein
VTRRKYFNCAKITLLIEERDQKDPSNGSGATTAGVIMLSGV